ncbi:MAG: hypothetical protein D6772_13490 [Bacteroidetes bacterium]|nr:MAG: hypothetical protein D6772_13490 [Bacteroidota bacterium]
MRTHIILVVLTSVFSTLCAQVRYTGEAFRDYYQWFHRYSQTADFYVDRSQLYTFSANTNIYQSTSFASPTIVQLPAGYALHNQVRAVSDKVESVRGGYGEAWYAVSGTYQGKSFRGYVWGGDLAKAWRETQLPGLPGHTQVLLGLSPKARRDASDLRACLRLVRNGHIEQEIDIPGACVFEDCAASTLLRVLNIPAAPNKVFEVSILTSGCLTGLDKFYINWDGQQLQLFYQGEWTTGTIVRNNPVYLQRGQAHTQLCYFEREDINYNPIWKCEPMKTAAVPVP